MNSAEAWPEPLRDRLPELMRIAIAEAQRGDDPFGCALADFQTGELLGAARNTAATDETAHAETNGLHLMAEKGLEPGRVVVVSSAEPCPMCAAACWWAHVRGVVWGTSIADLVRYGFEQIVLPCPDLLARAKPPSGMLLWGGFLADETDALYREGPKPRRQTAPFAQL